MVNFSHIPVDNAGLLNKQSQSAFSSGEEVNCKDLPSNCQIPVEENKYPVLDDIDIILNRKRIKSKQITRDLTIQEQEYWRNSRPTSTAYDLSEISGDKRSTRGNLTPVIKKGQKYVP